MFTSIIVIVADIFSAVYTPDNTIDNNGGKIIAKAKKTLSKISYEWSWHMNSSERRKAILQYLKEAKEPITGGQLSELFHVTRQVVVADIALLRATGEDIIGTPQGYVYNQPAKNHVQQKIAVVHSDDREQIREELYIIVDNGARVQDVIVEHPVYGEITGSLHIASRHDVDQFIEKLDQHNAEPLLVLTDGLHLHTITAENHETIERVMHALMLKGYLAK